MDTYLVGGAVRDKLLGIPVNDRDWVVVGTTPEAMIKAGYKAVGKDFPVFLHPDTHEEYALARTERKTGPGYHGFQFNTDITVTLEDDLLRRDLTLNAIAEDAQGNLIDPFNGQQDIQNKILRHVSPAFAEDPVRVLRVAKFMARFAHLDFKLADSTTQLVKTMVDDGEVDNLVAERVWQEFHAALSYPTPKAFFTTLIHTNALARIMPELHSLAGTPRALAALDQAVKLSHKPGTRFAALCAEFTQERAPQLEQFCQRVRASSAVSELALLSARYTQDCHDCLAMDAHALHQLLKKLDATRRPDRFNDFLISAQAHANAKTQGDYPQAKHLLKCANAMSSIGAAEIAKSQPNKSTISTAIKQAQVSAIDAMLSGR